MIGGFHVSGLRLVCQKIPDFFDWPAPIRLGAARQTSLIKSDGISGNSLTAYECRQNKFTLRKTIN